MRRDDILHYFTKFGNVRKVQIYKSRTYSYGFVTLESTESETVALSHPFHEIVGYKTKVAIVHSWHLIDSSVLFKNRKQTVAPIHLTNVTGTHLLDLNDDCLYKILSLRSFTLKDLLSMAESCTRLKDVAARVFARKHKMHHIVNISELTIRSVERILNNFVSNIPKLCIEKCRLDIFTRIMDLVMKYCKEGLESLTLNVPEIPATMNFALGPFKKLRSLYIRNVVVKRVDFFDKCDALVELKVESWKFSDSELVLASTFPKLERFEYNHIGLSIVYSQYKWQSFISRHKTLKTFSLVGFHVNMSPILCLITDHCKQLEKLQIISTHIGTSGLPVRENILMSLLTLNQLKSMEIMCNGQNVTNFVKELNSLKSLEFLEISYARADSEFLPALSQLKNLHSLRLTHFHELKNLESLRNLVQLTELAIQLEDQTVKFHFDLVDMIENLINLKTLFLQWKGLKIHEAMYLKIVDIVSRRPGRPKNFLTLKCAFDDDVADLQNDEMNRQIVKLDRIIPELPDLESLDNQNQQTRTSLTLTGMNITMMIAAFRSRMMMMMMR